MPSWTRTLRRAASPPSPTASGNPNRRVLLWWRPNWAYSSSNPRAEKPSLCRTKATVQSIPRQTRAWRAPRTKRARWKPRARRSAPSRQNCPATAPLKSNEVPARAFGCARGQHFEMRAHPMRLGEENSSEEKKHSYNEAVHGLKFKLSHEGNGGNLWGGIFESTFNKTCRSVIDIASEGSYVHRHPWCCTNCWFHVSSKCLKAHSVWLKRCVHSSQRALNQHQCRGGFFCTIK